MKDFLNKIVTLDNIKQWEEIDSVIKESVSQHSFKVSSICIFLLEKIKEFPSEFYQFKLKCVEYSVLHDFDESILGRDISHIIKYNNYNGSEIRNALSKFVDYTLEQLELSFLFKGVDKDVKLFCKLCDWIGLYTFVIRNENMGVKSLEKEKQYCLENIVNKRIECENMLKSKFGIIYDFSDLINNLTT